MSSSKIYMCTYKRIARCVIFFFLSLPYQSILAEESDDPFWSALTGGKFDFSARYRFEHVDDDARPLGTALKDADASTIRTGLGYETGRFHGFGARLKIVNITEVFSGDFNNTSNGKTQFAKVVDPDGTQVDEAYLSYLGLPETSLKLGRQYFAYRKAPFHRFIGTIPWRQRWQTMDVFSIENKSLPNTTLNYAYLWQVNRIFGEDATSPFDKFESDSHLVNIKYDAFPYAKLEGYAYLLDFDNAAGFSTDTYGIRMHGAYPFTKTIKGLYAVEYADQSDAANNPANIDAYYFLGEAGLKFKINSVLESLVLKFNYEFFEGKGGADRFNTILGTNHAYQGWADRFLITPGDGIEDIYFTAVAKIWGAKFIATYHNLNSDNLDYSYGDEINLLLTKTFKKHYTLATKYAFYDADRNSTNIAQNGTASTLANDISIFWVWGQIKF